MAGKISLALNIILAIAVIYLFTKIGTTSENTTKTNVPTESSVSEEVSYPSIAFVNNDSLTLNYNFRLDKSKILEKAAKDVQALETRLTKSQEDYYEIMNKSQTGGFSSDDEMKKAEAKLIRIQEDAPYLQNQMEKKLAKLSKLESEINDSLYARLYRYVDMYTSDKPIDVIMLYTKGMTGLYNNNSLDVTKELVDGLNKVYKEEKESTEEK